jgi:hypothetical protein
MVVVSFAVCVILFMPIAYHVLGMMSSTFSMYLINGTLGPLTIYPICGTLWAWKRNAVFNVTTNLSLFSIGNTFAGVNAETGGIISKRRKNAT